MSDAGSASASVLRGVNDPIPRALFRLALPILASHALRLAYQWVDALWVRGLGVDATAAVTTSVFVMWSVYSVNDIFAIGVVAYVSQLLGAGERGRAGVASYIALRSSLVLGLLFSLTGMFFAQNIFGLMTSEPGTLDQGTRYLSLVLIGSPTFLVALTGESIMRASGDSRTPFFIDLAGIGLNIVLDPFLIFGWGPFPAMGVTGAALATIISQSIIAGSYGVLAIRGHTAFPFQRSADGPPIRLSGVLKVGVPAAMIGVMFSLVYIAFGASAGRFGGAELAIVGIVNRLEALEYFIALAIGLAGSALVGQNLGARRPERAVEVIKIGSRWIAVFSFALSGLMITFPEFFLSLFTNDPAAIEVGIPYLRIVSLCFVFNGVEIVVAESILGSGHTRMISFIFVSFNLLRIPLAFFVPHQLGMGVLGIAWVIAITCIVRALIIIAWAARGTWKGGLASTLSEGADSR